MALFNNIKRVNKSLLPLLPKDWGSLQNPQVVGGLAEESLEEEDQVVGCMEGESLEEEPQVHMLQRLEEVALVEVSHFPMAQEDIQEANQVGGSSS